MKLQFISKNLEQLFDDYNIDIKIKDKFFQKFTTDFPLIQLITDKNYEEILKISKEMRNNIRGQDIGELG